MTRHPPKLAEALLRRACPPGLAGEGLLGDLREEFQRRGAVWYWRQAFSVSLRYVFEKKTVGPEPKWKSSGPSQPGRGNRFMKTLWQDVRYAIRSLTRQKGFAAVALITLAIGIGANTAIFSVVNGVLLQSLAYPEPDRVVRILGTSNGAVGRGTISYPNFLDVRDRSTAFVGLAAYDEWGPTMLGIGDPERLAAASVNANFFHVLGVRPLLGRFFSSDEDQLGHDAVVVIGYALWQRRFAGSNDVIDQTVNLNGVPYTIVGVAPPGFEDPQLQGIRWSDPQVWRATPSYFDPQRISRGANSFTAIARLRADVTLATAQAEVDAITQQLATEYPNNNTNRGMHLRTLKEQIVGPVRPALLVLLVSVALVLLIACANVANLMLSRAVGRQREMAIRTALGASRGRLMRQLITESLVLAVLGGALGIILAVLGTAALVGLAGESMPRASMIRVDGSVLLFTAGISFVTGIFFGLTPAARASQSNLTASMRDGGRAGSGTGAQRLRSGLVIAEVALSLVLFTGAGLLIKSLWRLQQVDSGLDAEHVLALSIAPSRARYPEAEDLVRVYHALEKRLAGLPGVEAVGATDILPMSGSFNGNSVFRNDRPAPGLDENSSAETRVVTPGYFEAMGMPLRRGRGFTESDRAGTSVVTIVNDAFVRQFYGDENPIGKHITFWSTSWEIIGVVGDVRQFGLGTDGGPAMYAPFAQAAFNNAMTITIRAATDPALLASAVRATIWEVDNTTPIYGLTPMKAVMAETVAQPRFHAVLLSIFAAVALLLATVGIAGVMAYTVSRRVPEIGLRLALGANRRDVLRLIVGQAVRLTAVGIAIGLVGAVTTTRLLSNLLFQVSATDLTTFVAAPAILGTIAILASYLPARHAGDIDPMTALRVE